MKHLYLHVLVFISGAAVLALEILGTRILGPFYGVSLFLWSALITVTLAALSVGYALGGRWADRAPQLSRLCAIMAAAGVWVLFIPWLKYPVLTLTEPMGLRVAVLIAAFILFAPPLTLLGMVSPYAIKLKTLSLAEVGRSAGNLYALSTIASVLSALATGFLLIPNFGVRRLTVSIGLLLLASAVYGLIAHKALRTKIATVLLVLAGSLGLWAAASTQADPSLGVKAVAESPYAELRVVDTAAGRHLLIDGGIHTIVDTLFFDSVFPYVAVMEAAQNVFENPGRALLLGLGGGSLAKNYVLAGWSVEAVEIDPAVTQMAVTHFGLDSSRVRIHHMDARQFLRGAKAQYDLIMVDAFGSSAIPFHLVTQEVFGMMKARLAPHGMLALNIETVGWYHALTGALTKTLQQHFTHVLTLPINEPPSRLGNLILFARDQEPLLVRELERNYQEANYRSGPSYTKVHAWDNRFTANTKHAPIFTDDLNPVEVWSEEINFAARKELHGYFGNSRLSW